MKPTVPDRTHLAAAVLWLGGLAACSPSIAPFSQTAYKLATDLKVESLKLMDTAEMPFDDQAKQVDMLSLELEKALEFAKGRPRNSHSTRQWEILLDPERHLLGGFFTRWRAEGSLSSPFIAEAKLQISDAFDTIIGLESGKIKAGSRKTTE